METRLFDLERDYEPLTEWYSAWGYCPIPIELLPPYGMIVSNDGEDIGAVWLYITDGKIGLLEGGVLNPWAPKSKRRGAHAFLIKKMTELAQEKGCLCVWVISKDQYITSVCKKQDFYCFDKDFKVLTKRL